MCVCPTGGFSARPLPIVPTAVQQKRTSFPSHLQPGRDARDPGGRGPGFDDGVHSHPLDGHEVHTRRQNVRKRFYAISGTFGCVLFCFFVLPIPACMRRDFFFFLINPTRSPPIPLSGRHC